jgi:hypothetical protein
MQYQKFKNIFNDTIFDKSKIDLMEKISKNPNRYLGLFRPTKPKAKILQNLLQSNEIRFGDAFEVIIENYLIELEYKNLNKKLITKEKEELNVDQYFKKDNEVYFIEQKIRDDHDSTKKRGQISNFEKKLNVLLEKHNEKTLKGIFYFIDPDLSKNKKYYQSELGRMSKDYGVSLYLLYGEELFSLLNDDKIWEEILKYLRKWKKQIPDLPETNFDLDYKDSFKEIKDLSPALFRRIFNNKKMCKEILSIIFPENKTLQLLLDYFKEKSAEKTIYKTLSEELKNRLNS